MPSHILHSIFAEDVIAGLDPELAETARTSPELDSAILMGAQGPDIFFHNRRTTPSGLLIGSVLHRKGYGSVAAQMLEYCLVHDKNELSPEGLYLLAFISHGVVDRVMHPFVNYFAGWVDPDVAGSEEYRSCHPFLERVMDSACALHKRPELFQGDAEAAQPLNALHFADRFDRGTEMHAGIAEMLLHALKRSYNRMSRDEALAVRIHNAYKDCLGFYHYSEKAHEGEIPPRWAALLHPLYLPSDVDFLNDGGHEWCDPASKDIRYSDGIRDMYKRAELLTRDIYSVILPVLKGKAPPASYPGLPEVLGDHGLRSDIRADVQPLKYSDPLPLKAVIENIASGAYGQDWLFWQDRFANAGSVR